MKPIISRNPRFIGTGLLLATAIPTMAAQMTDSFDDRPQVSEASVVLTADTTNATIEPGEQHLSDDRGRKHTVWAEWIAPANGIVVIDTLGTTFSSAMIGIYTGLDVSDLSPVAQGFDPSGPNPASVRFPAAAGQAYQIMLDSTLYNSNGDGPGTVNIRFAAGDMPSSVVGEDLFANRGTLTGDQALGVANNKMASLDPYEPDTIGRRDKSVWWEWTAPATGKVTIDTLESDFNTTLTVFAGDTDTPDLFPILDAVAVGKDLPNSERSRVSFQTQAGRTYQINVDGDIYNTYGEGNIVLKLSLENNTAPAAIPGADSFGRRETLTGWNAAGVACNSNFTLEAFEPVTRGNRDKTAWWEWTAPADGLVILDTINSNPVSQNLFRTSLKLYSGTELGSLSEIASGTAIADTGWTRLAFTAKKGAVYQIVVDGGIYNAYGEGNIVLNLNRAPTPEISVQQPVKSELTDGKSKVSFGTVRLKSKSAARVFTIRNTGTAPLTNLAVSRTGKHSLDFIVANLPRTTLAPGASMSFSVTFAPRARGTRSAVIQIRSNDADENPFDVTVTGMGANR